MVLMVANLKLIEISRQINVFFFVTRVVFDFLGAGTRARWGEPHRSNQHQSDLETSLLLFIFVWRNILIKEKSSHVMVSVFFFPDIFKDFDETQDHKNTNETPFESNYFCSNELTHFAESLHPFTLKLTQVFAECKTSFCLLFFKKKYF